MAKYLEVTNDNEVVIIDDETSRSVIKRNALLSSFTSEVAFSGGGQTPNQTSLDNNICSILKYYIPLGTNEFSIAIKPNVYSDTVGFSVELDSANRRCIVYVYLSTTDTSTFDASRYIIYFLGYMNITSSSPGWSGIEAYNELGNLVFSGLYNYMNIVATFNFKPETFDFECYNGIPIDSHTVNLTDMASKAFVINSIESHTVITSAHDFLDGPTYCYTYHPCYFVSGGLLIPRRWYPLFQYKDGSWQMKRRIGSLGSATNGFVMNIL